MVAIAVKSGSKKLPRSQSWYIVKDQRLSKGCTVVCVLLYSPGGGNERRTRESHLDAAWRAAMRDA